MNDRVRDERELVRRCREGSEAAYADLVRHHRPRLYALAYRLTNDRETAEDVVQEAFLAAFKSIDKVDPNPSLVPWLNTIAIRIAGRAASRRSAHPGPSLDRLMGASDRGAGPTADFASLDTATDPHTAAETAELRLDLADAIARLPFKYRAPVVLRFVMGLDYAEAAQTLELPLNTFKSHLLRGTRMLREQLGSRLDAARAPGATEPTEPTEPTALQPAPDGRSSASNGKHPDARSVGAFRDSTTTAADRAARS